MQETLESDKEFDWGSTPQLIPGQATIEFIRDWPSFCDGLAAGEAWLEATQAHLDSGVEPEALRWFFDDWPTFPLSVLQAAIMLHTAVDTQKDEETRRMDMALASASRAYGAFARGDYLVFWDKELYESDEALPILASALHGFVTEALVAVREMRWFAESVRDDYGGLDETPRTFWADEIFDERAPNPYRTRRHRLYD